MLEERHAMLPSFRERLAAVAGKHGERVLETPHNSISMAVTLTSGGGGRSPTAMGASLWVRLVSGARIVAPSSKKKGVAGIAFANYGSHIDHYPVAYFTAACAGGRKRRQTSFQASRQDTQRVEEDEAITSRQSRSPSRQTVTTLSLTPPRQRVLQTHLRPTRGGKRRPRLGHRGRKRQGRRLMR